MVISARKCRRVYDALPVYPRTAKPTVVAKRVGMGLSAFRSILVQTTFMYPICEDEEGRLSRMEGRMGELERLLPDRDEDEPRGLFD